MARRTRRKYYKRKGRWSANIRNLNGNYTIASGSFYAFLDLCTNPAQSDSLVSQQFTVKNTEFSFEIEVGNNSATQGSLPTAQVLENLSGYIMFVPQGYTVTETLPYTHPEWIMSYRFYGSPSRESEVIDNNVIYNSYSKVYKIKTRLSRRLQTGDKIIFLLTGSNETINNVNVNASVRGIARWWTKAN